MDKVTRSSATSIHFPHKSFSPVEGPVTICSCGAARLTPMTLTRPRQRHAGGFSSPLHGAGQDSRFDGRSQPAGNGNFLAKTAAANAGAQSRGMGRRDDDNVDDEIMFPSGNHGEAFDNRTRQGLGGFGFHHPPQQSIRAGGSSAQVLESRGGRLAKAHVVDDDDDDAGRGGDRSRATTNSRRKLSLSPGCGGSGDAGDGTSLDVQPPRQPSHQSSVGTTAAAAASAASFPASSLSAVIDIFADPFEGLQVDSVHAQQRQPLSADSEWGGGAATFSAGKSQAEMRASSEHHPSGVNVQPRPAREWRASHNFFGLDLESSTEDFEGGWRNHVHTSAN